MTAPHRIIHQLGSHFLLLFYAIRALPTLQIQPVRMVFYRQIYFTGWEPSRTLALLALLCGAMVATQAIRLAGGDSTLVVKSMAWVIVRELGPLLAALIIIARSSPAIASELALMKHGGEIASLQQMGIPPLDYLIVPRILGVTLAVTVLTIYFQLVAIGGGLAISAMFQDISFIDQGERFLSMVNPFELLQSVFKGLLFGLIIASISCHQGLSVGKSLTEIPQVVIKAVTRSMLGVFLCNILFELPGFLA